MNNPPFKFDFYHFGSDTACGDTISRLPILDWDGWYNPKAFEYGRLAPGTDNHKRGFTGNYNSTVYAAVVIARYKFCLRIDFAFGETTPEVAYREYHDRIKKQRNEEPKP